MLPRVLISLLALLMLNACGSSGNNLEKLHGKWEMDNKKTVDLSKEFGKMSKEMKAELLARMNLQGNVSIAFDVFTKQVTFMPGKLALPFQVKKDSGNTISISFNSAKPVKITFEKDNMVVINGENYNGVRGFADIVFIKVP